MTSPGTRQRWLPPVALAALGALGAPGERAAAQPPAAPDPVRSSYTMQVELLPQERRLTGRQQIRWRNTTGGTTRELRFHLYWNAFRDVDSTHMREAGEDFRAQWREDEFGSVTVARLEVERQGTRTDLTAALRFDAPDDGNAADATVLVAPLAAEVAPGEELVVHTEFALRIPKAYRRAGFAPDDGFFMMHWFPKLGVLQDAAAGAGDAVWNCHQFHAHTEFFAEFADYEVAITLPVDFVVGSTGQLQPESGTTQDGARKTLTYRAERVHDFAWVADPDFVEVRATAPAVPAAQDPVAVAVAGALGVPIADFDLPPTQVTLLLRPEHDTPTQRERHLEAVRAALAFFGLRYGPYPYPNITVVDPARDALGRRLGGGMEYPQLITCGTALYPHPRRMQPEGVTVHEFGHQYRYGLSANNEFEESWLDEGINTFSEGRAQWRHYGERVVPLQTSSFGLATVGAVAQPAATLRPSAGFALHALPPTWRIAAEELGFAGTLVPPSPLLDLLFEQPALSYAREARHNDLWNDRAGMLAVDNPDAMVRPGWLYRDRSSYVANSYSRPATLLRTLERMVGVTQWWAFLRRFHEQARFRHPTTAEFEALLAEVCGAPVAEFFKAARGAGAVLDYGVDRVEPEDGKGPVKTVTVRRFAPLPAEVRVRFRFTGREAPVYRTVRADDPMPWRAFRFADDEPEGPYGDLVEVWVDPPEGSPGGEPFENPGLPNPGGVYLLDDNLLNNAWRAQRDPRPALYRTLRGLLQTQSRLSFVGWIG